MSSQDPPANRVRPKSHQLPPKLRKNRKLELRWGNDYYEAVNKAVFSNDCSPYMPTEPPVTIKEDVDKTGYVCKQCRDCFRFLSSIEEHTSRRSWVLGYWCQACFATKCPHVGYDEPMCSICCNVEASKHAYLAEKGVRRNVRKAVTRVFYNQCQFFAHLRMHGIGTVDLSEVMLMPLPSGVRREDYGQLDKLCRALMETMFIRRIHIMDWLRESSLKPDHWNTLLNWMDSKKKTPISDIIGRYSEDCLNASDLAARTRKASVVVRRDVKAVTRPLKEADSAIDEKDPLAEDIAESPNDIAFVDCGPTPSSHGGVALSDYPRVDETIKSASNARTADRAKSLWRTFSRQYEMRKEKTRSAASRMSKDVVEISMKNIDRDKMPRVLKIRGPKNLNISTIMKHLPIEAMKTKNILVVADDSEGKNGGPSAITEVPVAVGGSSSLTADLGSEEKTLSPVARVNASESTDPKVKSSTSRINASPRCSPLVTKSQSFSEQMSLHGRIVFQNGRKYIIRHLPKSRSRSILQDSIVKKLHGSPALVAPVSAPRLSLLSRPVPVTKIATVPASDRSRDTGTIVRNPLKRAKVVAPAVPRPSGFSSAKPPSSQPQNGKVRATTKSQKTSLLVKCRESLTNDLRRASKRELRSYIDHLKMINERYSRAMKFEYDSVLANNARVIARFETIAETAGSDGTTERQPRDIFERSAREWETRIGATERPRSCDICDKRIKPAGYIVGVSLPARDETLYCRCYNSVCHVCNVNQGNLVQLKAHVQWHKGDKPYACPSCSIVFPSPVELEVHVWTSCFHPMAGYMYGCGVCEIDGILDMETIAQHFLLLHTRRKIICPECKMEYSGARAPTRADCAKHYAQHHPEIGTVSEPRRLLVCDLKQCIIRPELFRTHLSEHVGVVKAAYYRCPFCTVVAQGTGRNKSLIREHLVQNHLDRMHEIVREESVARIIEGIKLTPVNLNAGTIEGIGQICQVSNVDPSGPKILDARTITPATFELGTDSSEASTINDDNRLPRILEVRSQTVDEFESDEARAYDRGTPPVKALPDDSTRMKTSGKTSDEASIALNESTVTEIRRAARERNEDSSNSHDDDEAVTTLESIDSKINESENSSLADSSCNENGDAIMKDYIDASHLQALLRAGKHAPEKPWRIALNSPTDGDIEPVVYNCHLCGELIDTSSSVIKNHFESRHSSDYEIFTVSPSIPRVTMNSRYEADEGSRDDSSDSSNKRRRIEAAPANVAKRRKRWGPKKRIDRPGSPSLGICVKLETVQEIGGAYRCKKCNQAFEERSLLRNHIATRHRIKGQYLVCLECGENFVVVPSLQMHLKAVHGIEDPITYLTKNTAYAPDILDDTDEDQRATESNQCYVCMAVFEDKPALDKHMRVHGMAFLRRKRFEAQRALKFSARINDTAPKTGTNEAESRVPPNDEKLIEKEETFDDEARPAILETTSRNEAREVEAIEEISKVTSSPTT